jgi:hypothetical protein
MQSKEARKRRSRVKRQQTKKDSKRAKRAVAGGKNAKRRGSTEGKCKGLQEPAGFQP